MRFIVISVDDNHSLQIPARKILQTPGWHAEFSDCSLGRTPCLPIEELPTIADRIEGRPALLALGQTGPADIRTMGRWR